MQETVTRRGPSSIRTLLLRLAYPSRVSYYEDWHDAFVDSPDFDCTVRNILTLTPRELAAEIDTYDAAILLHSCNADTLRYFEPYIGVFAARKRAKLISFVGNEFNSLYVSMEKRLRLLQTASVDLIASQLLQETASYLYHGTGAQILSLPHALNTKVFRPGPEDDRRTWDVGVRGYRYPPYLGDDQRNAVLDYVATNGSMLHLTVDIQYDRRLSRDRWAEYLRDCRGTVSSESGSWYLEPTDALMRNIYSYLSSKRSGWIIKENSFARRLGRLAPMWVKSSLWKILQRGPIRLEVLDDYNTSFAELEELFFRGTQKSPTYGKAIASRHFDAIGTKTSLIMLRGRFNDILKADDHYFAIDQDFSNADEQLRRFKDAFERKAMVERAYQHICSEHTYSHRTATLRRVLDRVS